MGRRKLIGNRFGESTWLPFEYYTHRLTPCLLCYRRVSRLRGQCPLSYSKKVRDNESISGSSGLMTEKVKNTKVLFGFLLKENVKLIENDKNKPWEEGFHSS